MFYGTKVQIIRKLENWQISELGNWEVNKKAMLSKVFHNQFILLLLCQIFNLHLDEAVPKVLFYENKKKFVPTI